MVLNTSSPVNVRLIDAVLIRFRTMMRSYNLWQVLRFFVSVMILFSWGWNCLSVFDHFVGLALKGLNRPTRAYSSSLLRAIIASNHMPPFKVFSNFVHLAQIFITFKITLPFFWKRIGPVNITAPIKSSQFAIYEPFYYFTESEISRYCWITNCFSFLSFLFFFILLIQSSLSICFLCSSHSTLIQFFGTIFTSYTFQSLSRTKRGKWLQFLFSHLLVMPQNASEMHGTEGLTLFCIDPFHATGLFLYQMKISENL